LLALPLEVGAALGARGEFAVFTRTGRAGAPEAEGAFVARHAAGAGAEGVEAGFEEPLWVEDVEEADQEAFGAEAFLLGEDAAIGATVGDATGDGFAFEGVGEGFEEDGFFLGEGGIGAAAADDLGQGFAGGKSGAGALAMEGEFAEIDGGPGLLLGSGSERRSAGHIGRLGRQSGGGCGSFVSVKSTRSHGYSDIMCVRMRNFKQNVRAI
jgi:hypothetical protein